MIAHSFAVGFCGVFKPDLFEGIGFMTAVLTIVLTPVFIGLLFSCLKWLFFQKGLRK